MKHVVDIAKQLVSFNSENPPGNEKEISKWIYDFLDEIGFYTKLIKFGKRRYNVVAWIDSKSKNNGLMLYGHLDTVPIGKGWSVNPLGEIKNGKLYGRGSCDMKGGIASILSALIHLKEKIRKEKLSRKLLIVFVGDEEGEFRGSLTLLKKYRKVFAGIKYGIVVEPTDLEIGIAQKGVAEIWIDVKGKEAHASTPNLGINAVYLTCELINEIRKLERKLKLKKDKFLGHPTISVGKIIGGRTVNVVPSECSIGIDRRILPQEKKQDIKRELERIIKKKKINAKVRIKFFRKAFKLNENDRFVKIVRSISKRKFVGLNFYTEAELYFRLAGIKSIVFGPGNPLIAHKTNEYVSLSQLIEATKYYEKIVKKWVLKQMPN